ncbi:MAG: hypothetical protein IKE40_05175 [Firmicutes bacterium]|nr:hypothetical protein [Bacillota bacterium]
MTEKKNFYIYKWEERFRKALEGAYRVTVSIRDLEEEDCREALQALRAAGTQVYCALPVLWKPEKDPAIEAALPFIDGWYAGNIGQIRPLLDSGKPVMGDAGLNVFNEETARVLKHLGLSGATLSYELEEGRSWETNLSREAMGDRRSTASATGREAGADVPLRGTPSESVRPGKSLTPSAAFNGFFEYEVLRYGRVPAMVSEYCPLAGAEGVRGTGCGRCREENPVWLKDFKGERYPVLLDSRDCRSLILSRKPLDRPEADALAEERDDVIRRICVFSKEDFR